MFQNNNGAVIKHLARNDMIANRRRNIMTIVTIALAAALMMAIALIPEEIQQKQKRDEEGTAQAVFMNVSENTIGNLKNTSDVEWVGQQYSVGSMKQKSADIVLAYCDKSVLKASKMKLKGSMPQKSDEILVESSFFSHMGSRAKPGDRLLLDLGGGKKEYKISGLLQQQLGDSGKYAIVVSRAFVEGQKEADKLLFNAYIGIKNADSLTETELKQKIYTLANKFHITQGNVSIPSSHYRLMKDNITSNVLGYIAIAVIVLFGAGIVIYSIFYIAVAGKLREYGQLRTIGTTKKQIKKMVRKEGKYLSAVGIPIGLIAGGLVGYFMIPKGWNPIGTLFTAVIVGFIGTLFVQISISTPARKAANVSPMEAVRYSAYQSQTREKKSKKLHRKITPFRLAGMNFMRSRKKSILTLLSLGFSGILLVCATSVFGSYAPEVEAKRDFPYGEYSISIEGDKDTFSDSRIQMNNPLNQGLKDKILAVNGVKDIKEWTGIRLKYVMPNRSDSTGSIAGFSKSEVNLMKNYVTAGTLDYESLVDKAGVVLCHPKVFKESYGWSPQIGDKIKIIILNSQGKKVQKTLTVKTFISDNYRWGGYNFWVPVDSMDFITGMNCNDSLEIVTEKQEAEKVGESLQKIVDTNPNLKLNSLKEQIRYYSTVNRPVYVMFYVLISFIALFGIINLLNTVVTNLITRKKEIGILQAVGLSSRQLSRMLQIEGFLYTAGAVAVTLTLGTGLGYVVCMIVKNLGMAVHYRFPVLPVCIFTAVLLFIQLIISNFTVRNLKNQPLIERIEQG